MYIPLNKWEERGQGGKEQEDVEKIVSRIESYNPEKEFVVVFQAAGLMGAGMVFFKRSSGSITTGYSNNINDAITADSCFVLLPAAEKRSVIQFFWILLFHNISGLSRIHKTHIFM